MGRIEDALQKMQARGQPAPTERPARIARVSSEHHYGGKRVVFDPGALRAQGLLAPDSEARRLADEYRVIKRPLVGNASALHEPPIHRGNLVMVGSALSGEGKTFTCINLCLSVAREKDWTVVLVDGDCSKPHLTRLFGAEKERGLLDLLRDGSLELESMVMPTDVPGLSLLPAGGRDVHSVELLASQRMSDLCDALATSDPQRMIVFDSSPLLMTTEAPILASQVGQVVVVVHAGHTPQQAVVAGLDKLDPSKAINLVLNQLDASRGPLGYGDYYGYGEYGS